MVKYGERSKFLSTKIMATEAEKRSLEEEFKWLLKQEYRPRVEAISNKLQECKKRFEEALSSRGDPIRPILLQNDSALCTAAIEGDKIVKAEINVKSGRGSRAFRTTIKEHHPWMLKQIQDAANYLFSACKWMDKVGCEAMSGLEILSPPTSPNKSQDKSFDMADGNRNGAADNLYCREPAEIKKSFDELTRSLRKAESSLLLPPPISAAQIYAADQLKNTLRPSLPEDTALNFHICSATLVVTILTVSQITKSQLSSQRNIPNQGLGTYWMGSTFEHSNNLYEVTHQVQTSSVIPWLSKVLTLIQSTLQLAQDFNDKVQVFETMGVALQSHSSSTQQTTPL